MLYSTKINKVDRKPELMKIITTVCCIFYTAILAAQPKSPSVYSNINGDVIFIDSMNWMVKINPNSGHAIDYLMLIELDENSQKKLKLRSRYVVARINPIILLDKKVMQKLYVFKVIAYKKEKQQNLPDDTELYYRSDMHPLLLEGDLIYQINELRER